MKKKFIKLSLFLGIVLFSSSLLLVTAVKPDNIPPVVTILNPTDGTIVNGLVTITFDAYDQQNSLREYGIRIDGNTVSTYSFSYDWDTTSFTDGLHTIEAYAWDKTVEGTDSITVTIDNGGVPDTTPPVVEITAPIDGATVFGTITITISATDENGIDTQAIFIDGLQVSSTSTYDWDTTLETDGPHTISAEATDPSSNLGSDSISVAVNNTITGAPFKVMTFNIKESGEDPSYPDWKEVVYEENADIIIFVETGYWDDNDNLKLNQYTTEFNTYFSNEDPYVSYTLQDISYSTSGEAIMSRFPITEFNQIPIVTLDDSSSYDVTHDFLHTVVDVDGTPIHIIGSHLKAMTGIDNEQRREWEQEGIINYMDDLGSVPIMYMGDLNSFSPEDYTLNTLQSGLGYGPLSMMVPPFTNPDTSEDFSQYQSTVHQFTDVFRTLHPTDLGITTPAYDSRIDFIYVNDPLVSALVGSTTGDTAHALTGSDHLTVDAIIDLSGTGGDYIPPTVTITNPIDDSVVSDTITITMDATDDDSVVSHRILIDGIEVSTSTSYVWDTTSYSEGLHTIRAEATDPSDNVGIDQITVTVDNDGIIADPSMVVINEYLPDPFSLYSEEWIELYNPITEDIDLSGCVLDDLIGGGTSAYTIPDNTIITTGGYLVFYQSTTGLALNNDGDDVNFIDTDGSTVIDTHTYSSSSDDVSIGRETDGSTTWVTFATPTPGAANEGGTGGGNVFDIVINEYLPDPYVLYTEEWIELHNPSAEDVDLTGCVLDDLIGGGTAAYTIPDNTIITTGGYLVFYQSTTGLALNNDGDDVNFIATDGTTVIDSHTYSSSTNDVSIGRETDGASTWTTFTSPTPGAANGGGSSSELHVNSITMSHQVVKSKYTIYVTVEIFDENNNPVENAYVTVELTLPDGKKQVKSGYTDADGKVTFEFINLRLEGTYFATVTDVSLSGYSYNSNANIETTDQYTI